jgi:hypothetical protein
VANAIDFYLMAQLGIDSCWRFRLQKSWTDSYTLPSARVSCKIKTNDAVPGGWQRPAWASVGGSFDQRKSLLTTLSQIRAEVRYSMVKPIHSPRVYIRDYVNPHPLLAISTAVVSLPCREQRRGVAAQVSCPAETEGIVPWDWVCLQLVPIDRSEEYVHCCRSIFLALFDVP